MHSIFKDFMIKVQTRIFCLAKNVLSYVLDYDSMDLVLISGLSIDPSTLYEKVNVEECVSARSQF